MKRLHLQAQSQIGLPVWTICGRRCESGTPSVTRDIEQVDCIKCLASVEAARKRVAKIDALDVRAKWLLNHHPRTIALVRELE